MRVLWTNIRKLVFFAVLGISLGVCSAYPDPAAPGNCTLSCGDSKIAANNMRVRFLAGTTLNTACEGVAAGSDYPGSIPIQFVIEQTLPDPLPAASIPGDTTTATELEPDVGTPVPGISFEASIIGGLTSSNDNPTAAPHAAKYKGIATSQDQWCTDSCGVGLVEVVPLCFGLVNTIGVQIHSGAAAAVTTITVNP